MDVLKKRPVAIGISIVLVLIALLWGINNRDPENGLSGSVIQTVTPTPSPDPTPTPGGTATPVPSPTPARTTTPLPEGALALGATFELDDFIIALGDTIGWTTVDRDWSDFYGRDVFYLPITLTNLSAETRAAHSLFVRAFGPNGLELDRIGWDFQNDLFSAGHMRPGAILESYMHILYEGEGEYVLEFVNWDWQSDDIEVIFQVQRG